MQREISIPGMPNWWLMPIETRIGMLTTGMRGLLGLKLYGTDLDELAKIGVQLEEVLKDVPGTLSVVAERAMGGHYIDITVNRKECARYGLKVGDVQRMVETAIGGMNIATTVEGRYRFPINVRYPRELRDDPQKLEPHSRRHAQRATRFRLGQVAEIKLVDGPPVIKSETGLLLVNIPVDIEAGLDIGTYVKNAQAEIDKAIAQGRLKIARRLLHRMERPIRIHAAGSRAVDAHHSHHAGDYLSADLLQHEEHHRNADHDAHVAVRPHRRRVGHVLAGLQLERGRGHRVYRPGRDWPPRRASSCTSISIWLTRNTAGKKADRSRPRNCTRR